MILCNNIYYDFYLLQFHFLELNWKQTGEKIKFMSLWIIPLRPVPSSLKYNSKQIFSETSYSL